MEQKERISITIDKKLLKWIDGKVDDRLFANRSHGLEFLARKKMKSLNPESSVDTNNFWSEEKT